jgi:hypothetical protein
MDDGRNLYIYELRRGEEVVATGQLTRDSTLEVGDRVRLGGREGIVRSILPVVGRNAQRLIVQLLPGAGTA